MLSGATLAVVLIWLFNSQIDYQTPHHSGRFGPALVFLVVFELFGVIILSVIGGFLGSTTSPGPHANRPREVESDETFVR